MTIADKLKRLIEQEYIYIYKQMEESQMICLEYSNEKINHACISKDGIAYTITARIDNSLYYIVEKK